MRQVAVTGLHKAFGTHPVLAGVDLEVPAGSLTAILGPSGSGKTTLLRLMAGFDRADAGTIKIGDVLVDGPGVHTPPERRRIGYVPQEGSLFPHLTVEANVGFGLAARALAIEPAVVLLDEPFASLDAQLRASVRADVQEIFRRAGTTAVLVTHDQDEALSVADRVAALRDGKIAQCATPEDLYCRPADPELASFVGDANLLEGVLNGGVVKTLLGNLPLDAAAVTVAGTGQVTVLIRPEQIELEPSADGVPGRVTAFGYHGHDAVVHVQPEHDADGRTIVVRITGGSPLAVGSPVNLRARGPVFAWRRD